MLVSFACFCFCVYHSVVVVVTVVVCLFCFVYFSLFKTSRIDSLKSEADYVYRSLITYCFAICDPHHEREGGRGREEGDRDRDLN